MIALKESYLIFVDFFEFETIVNIEIGAFLRCVCTFTFGTNDDDGVTSP